MEISCCSTKIHTYLPDSDGEEMCQYLAKFEEGQSALVKADTKTLRRFTCLSVSKLDCCGFSWTSFLVTAAASVIFIRPASISGTVGVFLFGGILGTAANSWGWGWGRFMTCYGDTIQDVHARAAAQYANAARYLVESHVNNSPNEFELGNSEVDARIKSTCSAILGKRDTIKLSLKKAFGEIEVDSILKPMIDAVTSITSGTVPTTPDLKNHYYTIRGNRVNSKLCIIVSDMQRLLTQHGLPLTAPASPIYSPDPKSVEDAV